MSPDRAIFPQSFTINSDGSTTPAPPAGPPGATKVYESYFTASGLTANGLVATSGSPQIGGGVFATLAGQEARIAIALGTVSCLGLVVEAQFTPTTAGGSGSVDVWAAAQPGGGGRVQLTNQSILNTYAIGGGSPQGGQASGMTITRNVSFWLRYTAFQNFVRGEFWGSSPDGLAWIANPGSYVDTATEAWQAVTLTQPEIRINNSDASGSVVCNRFRIWELDSIKLQ